MSRSNETASYWELSISTRYPEAGTGCYVLADTVVDGTTTLIFIGLIVHVSLVGGLATIFGALAM